MTVPYPQINGNQYQHSSIKLFINNNIVTGVKSINYKDSLTPVMNYGTSATPIGRTKGKYTASGEVEVYLPDWDDILNTLGPSFMTAIFDIVVTYQDFNQTDRRDTLTGCRIEDVASQSSEDANPLTVKLKLNVFSIAHSGVQSVV